MSSVKPIIKELKQAALKGFAHLHGKFHQVADNMNDHLDDVAKRVRARDKFDEKPSTPAPPAKPALTGTETNRVDRTSTELLYRSDNRPPEEIFRDGFQVRDASNNDLNRFVHSNGPSNFVSTTRDENLYKQWPAEYRYTVDSPGGIDVDATMPNGPFGPGSYAPESEIAFQGGVPAEHIVGGHPVLPDGNLGNWAPNPNYSGGR